MQNLYINELYNDDTGHLVVV